MLLAVSRNIDGDHLTLFIQWRCVILVGGKTKIAFIIILLFYAIQYIVIYCDDSAGYNVYYKKQDEKRWTVMFADRTTFLVLRNLSFDSTYYVRVNVHYSDDIKAKLSRTAVIKTFSLGVSIFSN